MDRGRDLMLVLRTSTARRGSSRHKLPSASSTNEIGSAGADGAGGGSILSTGVGAGDSTRTSTGCVGVAARRAWVGLEEYPGGAAAAGLLKRLDLIWLEEDEASGAVRLRIPPSEAPAA